ncbi:MAG TPA: hypothetical protein VIH27_01075 [Nitrososphaerales archaeon]
MPENDFSEWWIDENNSSSKETIKSMSDKSKLASYFNQTNPFHDMFLKEIFSRKDSS